MKKISYDEVKIIEIQGRFEIIGFFIGGELVRTRKRRILG